jgi:hypothetical protein
MNLNVRRFVRSRHRKPDPIGAQHFAISARWEIANRSSGRNSGERTNGF